MLQIDMSFVLLSHRRVEDLWLLFKIRGKADEFSDLLSLLSAYKPNFLPGYGKLDILALLLLSLFLNLSHLCPSPPTDPVRGPGIPQKAGSLELLCVCYSSGKAAQKQAANTVLPIGTSDGLALLILSVG